MSIRSNQKTIFYISQYNKNSEYIKYNIGDKVIIKIDGKTISGEIYRIGRKKVCLKTGVELRYRPRLDGLCSQLLSWSEINIEDIEKLAKYPDTYQRLGFRYMK